MKEEKASRNLLWNFLVNGVLASRLVPMRWRARALRCCGLDVHPSARISPGAFFYGSRVTIGEGTFVNVELRLATGGPVTIGSRCNIAPYVAISATDHVIGASSRRAGDTVYRPVVIGDGTWVGIRALILPGVTIGSGCIIAAGAVVTKDCDNDGLYAGFPARRVRDLS